VYYTCKIADKNPTLHCKDKDYTLLTKSKIFDALGNSLKESCSDLV